MVWWYYLEVLQCKNNQNAFHFPKLPTPRLDKSELIHPFSLEWRNEGTQKCCCQAASLTGSPVSLQLAGGFGAQVADKIT